MLSGKRVLLIVGGGIAAYKTPELVRLIRKAGGHVRVILTKAGAEFVTPLTLASLTGEKVHDALFSLTDEIEMGHIELSRSADLVVVAPATADLMAKAANGLANDLASTALLATDKPVLMAPAMNVRMAARGDPAQPRDASRGWRHFRWPRRRRDGLRRIWPGPHGRAGGDCRGDRGAFRA
jgi:phosphopantothenoylcysteine decarboxylase / phosphopantothenate---cysteine ligase